MWGQTLTFNVRAILRARAAVPLGVGLETARDVLIAVVTSSSTPPARRRGRPPDRPGGTDKKDMKKENLNRQPRAEL